MSEKRAKPGKPKGRGNGEGSVFERTGLPPGSKKTWVAQYTLPSGDRKQIYCESKQEAQKALRKALNDLDQGRVVEGRDQTVKEYIEFWIDNVQRLRVRESTYHGQKAHVKKHIVPSLGRYLLRKLTTDQIESFYADLFREGLSPGTIKHIHAILHKAFDQALRKRKILTNVFDLVTPPRYSLPERKPLTFEQARQLLALVEGHWMEMLVKLALATGMRRGELLALRWDDIDFADQSLQVRHTVNRYAGRGFIESEPKTDRGRRKILLPLLILEALGVHRTQQEEQRQKAGQKWRGGNLVFCNRYGSYLDPGTVRLNFLALLQAAGLPLMHFHDLRHSSATFLLAMKINARVVQERLGHSHVNITLALYGHVIPGMQEEAAQKIGGVFEVGGEKQELEEKVVQKIGEVCEIEEGEQEPEEL